MPPAERAARVSEVYDVFHAALAQQIRAFAVPPALVTVHSFTPRWHGEVRSTEIGLLHDEDATLAQTMQQSADGTFSVELNVPYSSSDGVTHMLARHGTGGGLRNVMIEVRNDLLAADDQIIAIANMLEDMLSSALAPQGHTI